MFWILLLLFLITFTISKEKYSSNHETVLHSVQFQSTNGTSTGVPLFVLKMNLQKPYPMCYPNSSNEQTVKLSLAICKHLGYDALQSFFPADVSVLNTIPPGKGLYFRTNCSSYQLEQQFCHWRFIGKEICDKYLGLECAECNYAVEITGGKKREIQFPAYVSCFVNSKCQWNIINRNPKNKVTVLEFTKEYFEVSRSNTSPYEDYDDDHSGQIEVKWFNPNNKRWTALRTTVRTLDNVDPIKIETSNITISYFSKDCQLNATKKIRRNVATLKYYNEESTFSKQENSELIVYILAFVFGMALITSIIMCFCCYFRTRNEFSYSRKGATGTYSMSYIPGLNLSYEDEDNFTAAQPIATSQEAITEDENTNLVQNNSQIQNLQSPELSDSADSDMTIQANGNSNLDFCSGQHRGVAKTDQLQNIITQLSTKYKPKRIQKFEDNEDMFSCKSDDSHHSFYSVHPSRRTSRSDSFISTTSDGHQCSIEEITETMVDTNIIK